MRKWIWKALDEVVNKDVYSNLYLRNHLHEVDKKDRALATRIFYGTIQNYRYCKACWSKYVKNKSKNGCITYNEYISIVVFG